MAAAVRGQHPISQGFGPAPWHRRGMRCAKRRRAGQSTPALESSVLSLGAPATLCPCSPSRCLTLRSSGPPPAWPLAREPVQVIIRLAGQAPHRWCPLSSNVRQTQSARSMGHPSTLNQALVKVSRTNAAQSAATTRHSLRVARQEVVAASARSKVGALGAGSPASPHIRSARAILESGFWACAHALGPRAERQAAQGCSASARAMAFRFQSVGTGRSVASVTRALPATSCIPSNRTVLESGSWACAFVAIPHATHLAAQGWPASAQTMANRFQARGAGCSLPSFTRALPNPSLERTSTGLALGPRTGQCHHPLRGPSTNPVASAQLKR